MKDPTLRFSDRVADYVRARPAYPPELLGLLRESHDFAPSWIVADVGSGTGNLSRLFLDAGNRVYGVEPNADMRRAAERLFEGQERFVSVEGRAERTGLPAASVDLVAAGQAFHWFDRRRARAEFLRILRPGRPVALIWNHRAEDRGPLMCDYERLLQRYGTDYDRVRRLRPSAEQIARFFGVPAIAVHVLAHRQSFDREGLRARLRSSSYVPAPGEPGHRELLAGLDALFELHQRDGRVAFDYDTRVYVGLPEKAHRKGRVEGRVGHSDP